MIDLRIILKPPACLLACLMFISACTTPTDPEKKNETPNGPPRLVGRVASIPAEKTFLLIESYGAWNITEGTILVTRGPDQRTSNLLVTGEKLGQYAAADIQAGDPAVGDAVLLLPNPSKKSTLSEPDPAASGVEVD